MFFFFISSFPSLFYSSVFNQSPCFPSSLPQYMAHTHVHAHTYIARAHTRTHTYTHHIANTSNDLAIARQIQEEFCQQAGVRVVRVSTRGAAAEGRGAPGVMTYKSNFESMRFLSDDPTYFDRGYELGRGETKR